MDILAGQKPVNLYAASAADRLLDLKKKHSSDPWPVIEECINIWKDSKPKQWQSYVLYLDEVREGLSDKKHGKGNDKNSSIRYTLDIPQTVYSMIRCVYNADELPMDKSFFSKFGRKFKQFQIAEKI